MFVVFYDGFLAGFCRLLLRDEIAGPLLHYAPRQLRDRPAGEKVLASSLGPKGVRHPIASSGKSGSTFTPLSLREVPEHQPFFLVPSRLRK